MRKSTPDHDVRILAVMEWVRNGLWLIPTMAIAMSVLLATALMAADRAWPDLPTVFHGDSSSAQSLLSTIATATVTMTTLVLSITIVALQLASQQFSPRVMRTFFRDTGTKVSLGLFLAPAVYALFVLRAVVPGGGDQEPFVPKAAISVAFILAVMALLTFVYYLDHVTHAIRVVHIIDAVAAESRAAIDELIETEHRSEQFRRRAMDDHPEKVDDWPDRPADRMLCSEQPPGVLINLDEDDLVHLAVRRGVRIRFLRRVGDHLPSGIALAEVWSDGAGDNGESNMIEAAELVRLTGLGHERTMSQDVAFGFRQLVDIAEKALSPALNDPTTAVQSIDRIHDLLRRLARWPDAQGVYRDAAGIDRLAVPQYHWEDYVRLGFDEIRQYGHDSVQVHQRLRATIADLATMVADDPTRQEALHLQTAMLDRSAAASFTDPEDQARACRPHLAG